MQVATVELNPVPAVASSSAAAATKASAAVSAPTVSRRRPSLAATYSYHENLHQVVVTMYRPDTGQVIRKIPPDAIIAMAEAILSASQERIDQRA